MSGTRVKLKPGHVRVLRVIEYIGPKEQVAMIVKRSIHGHQCFDRESVIRAKTVSVNPHNNWGDMLPDPYISDDERADIDQIEADPDALKSKEEE